jgi:hypothetical protein
MCCCARRQAGKGKGMRRSEEVSGIEGRNSCS